jgi:hypothetical protein
MVKTYALKTIGFWHGIGECAQTGRCQVGVESLSLLLGERLNVIFVMSPTLIATRGRSAAVRPLICRLHPSPECSDATPCRRSQRMDAGRLSLKHKSSFKRKMPIFQYV